jgi:hypothetical protein
MKEFGIPEKLNNLVKMILRRTLNKVKIIGKLTDSFETTCGLRQGDARSTVLFNITLVKVMHNIELKPGGGIFTRTRQYMAYADDMAAIGKSLQAVNKVIQHMEEPALSIWLDIVTYQGSPVTQQLNGASLLYSLISATMKTNASS